jgi:NADH:ubiquinone oxidoreductase subunit D
MGGAIGGGGTLFLHTFRERELILDLFEDLTGGRFHYNHHTPGGQRHDIPAGWDASVKQVLDFIESRLPEYEDMTDNRIFFARTKGVGVIDPVLLMELGVSGPVARASGIDHDLRRDAPYCAYDKLDVRVAVETGGDCYARFLVRMAEMRESIRLVRELIDSIPSGPIVGAKMVKLAGAVKFKPAKPRDKDFGAVYSAIESPRGELGTFVVGEPKKASPWRCKIRPPSYHLVSLLPFICPGEMISDIIVILGSLDPILGEVDR